MNSISAESLGEFWRLSDPSAEVRNDAAGALQAAFASSTSDGKTYILTRLIRGLADPTNFARLGFSVALTAVLRSNQDFPIQELLAISSKALTMPTDGGYSRKEKIDWELGRVFFVLCTLRAGVMSKNQELSSKFFNQVLNTAYAAQEKGGKLSSRALAAISFETVASFLSSGLIGGVKQFRAKALSEMMPNEAAAAIADQSYFWNEMSKALDSENSTLSELYFLAADQSFPSIHPLWARTLQHLQSVDAKLKFSKVWDSLITEVLPSVHSPRRRFVVISLISKIFEWNNSDKLAEALSPPVVSLIGSALSSSSHPLHKQAKALVRQCTDRIPSAAVIFAGKLAGSVQSSVLMPLLKGCDRDGILKILVEAENNGALETLFALSKVPVVLESKDLIDRILSALKKHGAPEIRIKGVLGSLPAVSFQKSSIESPVKFSEAEESALTKLSSVGNEEVVNAVSALRNCDEKSCAAKILEIVEIGLTPGEEGSKIIRQAVMELLRIGLVTRIPVEDMKRLFEDMFDFSTSQEDAEDLSEDDSENQMQEEDGEADSENLVEENEENDEKDDILNSENTFAQQNQEEGDEEEDDIKVSLEEALFGKEKLDSDDESQELDMYEKKLASIIDLRKSMSFAKKEAKLAELEEQSFKLRIIEVIVLWVSKSSRFNGSISTLPLLESVIITMKRFSVSSAANSILFFKRLHQLFERMTTPSKIFKSTASQNCSEIVMNYVQIFKSMLLKAKVANVSDWTSQALCFCLRIARNLKADSAMWKAACAEVSSLFVEHFSRKRSKVTTKALSRFAASCPESLFEGDAFNQLCLFASNDKTAASEFLHYQAISTFTQISKEMHSDYVKSHQKLLCSTIAKIMTYSLKDTTFAVSKPARMRAVAELAILMFRKLGSCKAVDPSLSLDETRSSIASLFEEILNKDSAAGLKKAVLDEARRAVMSLQKTPSAEKSGRKRRRSKTPKANKRRKTV